MRAECFQRTVWVGCHRLCQRPGGVWRRCRLGLAVQLRVAWLVDVAWCKLAKVERAVVGVCRVVQRPDAFEVAPRCDRHPEGAGVVRCDRGALREVHHRAVHRVVVLNPAGPFRPAKVPAARAELGVCEHFILRGCHGLVHWAVAVAVAADPVAVRRRVLRSAAVSNAVLAPGAGARGVLNTLVDKRERARAAAGGGAGRKRGGSPAPAPALWCRSQRRESRKKRRRRGRQKLLVVRQRVCWLQRLWQSAWCRHSEVVDSSGDVHGKHHGRTPGLRCSVAGESGLVTLRVRVRSRLRRADVCGCVCRFGVVGGMLLYVCGGERCGGVLVCGWVWCWCGWECVFSNRHGSIYTLHPVTSCKYETPRTVSREEVYRRPKSMTSRNFKVQILIS